MIKVVKILVPVDFSPCAKNALKYAIHFGSALQAKSIDVLHVWRAPQFVEPEAKIQLEGGREQTLAEFVSTKAGQTMKDFLAEIEESGQFSVHGRLESGEPHQSILQVSTDEHYDLIIMGTHGERKDVKLGSIAQKVVRNASCPVLTIRLTEEC